MPSIQPVIRPIIRPVIGSIFPSFGARIISGTTTDSVPTPSTSHISFTFSSAIATPNLLDGITVTKNGVDITADIDNASETPVLINDLTATYKFLTNLWVDGDVIAVALDNTNGFWVEFVEGTPISDQNFTVANLYNAPAIQSVILHSTTTALASFAISGGAAINDDGGSLPYTGDVVMQNCTQAIPLTITGVTNNGDNTALYTFSEPVAPNDIVEWSSNGVPTICA